MSTGTLRHTLPGAGRAVLGRLYEAVCGGDASVPAAGDAFLTWCGPGQGVPGRDRRAVAELADALPAGRGRLSAVYGEILRRCRVPGPGAGLSDEERVKVRKFHGLLRTTTRIAGRDVTDDGPMVTAYLRRQAEYLDAVLGYHLERVAGGPDWASGAEWYRRQVAAATDAWVSCGYRDEVDQVTAYLDEAGARDVRSWRRDLLALYDAALVDGLHHTVFVPADLEAGVRWHEFAFDGPTADDERRLSPGSWRSGIAGVPLRMAGVAEVSRISLRLRLGRVLVSRPWLHAGFLDSPGWTLDGEPVSDGGDPPSGRLPGYPTAALFARDLRVDCPELAGAYPNGVPHGLRWGPFELTGGRVDGTCISVPDIRLIGFVNRRVGRSPRQPPQLDTEPAD